MNIDNLLGNNILTENNQLDLLSRVTFIFKGARDQEETIERHIKWLCDGRESSRAKEWFNTQGIILDLKMSLKDKSIINRELKYHKVFNTRKDLVFVDKNPYSEVFENGPYLNLRSLLGITTFEPIDEYYNAYRKYRALGGPFDEKVWKKKLKSIRAGKT